MNLGSQKVELNLIEISAKILPSAKIHENLLANATITFKFESGEYFTITSCSIWRSKFNGKLNLQMPRKGSFVYCLFEKSLRKKIEGIALNAYEYWTIEAVKS